MINVFMVPTGGLRREGITTSLLEITKRIDKKAFSITIAAVHNNAADVIEEFRSYGCNVIKFPDRKNRKSFFKYCLAVRQELNKGYDIIHVHGSSAIISIELFIAKCCGVKVRIAHSRNTRCDNTIIDILLRPFLYKTYTYALACGTEAGEWLFPNREFEIIHNGKDLRKFCFSSKMREKLRNELNLKGKVVYGHVGNINVQKNHTFLIDVFSVIKQNQDNAILYLMGDGALMNEIRAKVHSLGLDNDVVFTGRVNDVHQRLMAMDVMIFPSLFEGLPNVVLEWQAEGLPCLIADTITKECALTDIVHFMSLNDSLYKWSNMAISLSNSSVNREIVSQNAIISLTNEGYEINECSHKLEDLYFRLMRAETEA